MTAVFNILAASAIVLGICYDSYRAWKKELSYRRESRFKLLRWIHPAEVFPLSLSTAIIMQGSVFIAVQSMGLNTLFINNCKAISQVVWPTVWLVAIILVVFGVEVAYRGFKDEKFGPRGPWNTPICWSTVAFLMLLIWIPSRAREAEPDRCLANLIFFASTWSDFGVAINSLLVLAYLVLGSLITWKLYKTAQIDREERIAASRMVYYLAVGAFLMLFVLPFWANFVAGNFKSQAPAKTASIALNVFGLFNALLHLVLRANADNLAIRPPHAAWSKRREWRIFGSADLSLANHIDQPIYMDEQDDHSSSSSEDKKPLPGWHPPMYPGPSRLQDFQDNDISNVGTSGKQSRHTRNQSTYSLFPTNDPQKGGMGMAGGFEDLAPPRPFFAGHHKRDSSNFSSATVQIGLRLSNAALPAAGASSDGEIRPPLPTQQVSDDSILLPIQRGDAPQAPRAPPEQINLWKTSNNHISSNEPQTDALARKDSLNKTNRNRDSWQRDRDARYKTLPPIPPSPTVTKSPRTIQVPAPPPEEPLPTPPMPQPRRMTIRPTTAYTTGPRTPQEDNMEILNDTRMSRMSSKRNRESRQQRPNQNPGDWPLGESSGILLPSTVYKPQEYVSRPPESGWI